MYRIIIADDEKHVRDGLSDAVPWEEYHMVVEAAFQNGQDAWDHLRAHSADIVISDVRMPEMDGLELCQRVRESYPQVKFVFISGFADVDYLKTAIASNAVDYLFKPVNLDELKTILLRLQTEKDEEQHQKQTILEMEIRLQESMPLLREKFLLELISRPMDNENIEKRCVFLDLPLPGHRLYQLVVIKVDNSRLFFAKQNENRIQLFCMRLLELCRQVVDQVDDGIVFNNGSAEFVLLFFNEIPPDRVVELFEALQQDVLKSYGSSVTVGLSLPFHELQELYKSFHKAQRAIEQKLYLGKNQIIHFDILEPKETEGQEEFLSADGLRSILASGDYERTEQYIQSLFGQVCRQRSVSLDYVRTICLQIVLICHQTLCEVDSKYPVEGQTAQLIEKTVFLETAEDICGLAQECATHACNRILGVKQAKGSHIVARVLQLIEQNCGDHLTIQSLAEQVYLSPQYLCILFKQHTGHTVNDHVSAIRIEKAKRLLKDTNYKLADIASQVGYADSSYFTKQFKKMVGVTPSDYRSLPAQTEA